MTAAGNVTHEQVLDLVAARIRQPAAQRPAPGQHVAPVTGAPIHLEKKRDLEQVHLCVGVPSVPLGHEDRFGVAVLNNLLGGGMSSRLFQNIREKRGLAYAVFSELTPYSDAGMLTVYAGTAKETVGQVLDLIVSEFRDLKESPVTEEELTRSKNHLKGSLMLSLESTSFAHVQSGAPGTVFPALLFAGRNPGLHRSGHARRIADAGAGNISAPEDTAVTVLGPERFRPRPLPPGLLRSAPFFQQHNSNVRRTGARSLAFSCHSR